MAKAGKMELLTRQTVRGEAGTFSEANCCFGSQTHAQHHAFCVKLCAVAGSPLLFVPDQGGRPYLVLTSQNGMRLPKTFLTTWVFLGSWSGAVYSTLRWKALAVEGVER